MSIKPLLTDKAFKEHINPIISNPLNAIVELIANAYDAGATELKITWAENSDLINPSRKVSFKDNGVGMSKDEFEKIWVQLSYDRVKQHGKYISISGHENIHREVYGKNGKGRHAPFSFSDNYTIKTIKNNMLNCFIIESSDSGFIVTDLDQSETEECDGTEVLFNLDNNNDITISEIKETIATRFLKDDYFKIYINDEEITLKDISKSKINELECKIDEDVVKIIQLESSNTSNYNKFHGLSWKVGNRLIHDKSWDGLLDGRKRVSKKFNFIIYADILKDYTNETMTEFIKHNYVTRVRKFVYSCIKRSLSNFYKQKFEYDKKEILMENLHDLRKLSSVNQEELGQFITEVQESCPNMKFEDLKVTTEIFIKLAKAQSGYELLHNLAQFNSSKDYDVLNEIIKEWDVHSAKIVLDEIKWRLGIIKELRLKMDNPNTDELHELQPIFEKGLWIFGPEFEAIEYTSNESLSNVIRKLFKKDNIDVESPLSRPDFVVLPEDGRSVSLYSSPSFNKDNETDDVGKLLIIELKKGGFKITSNEVHQTQRYIEQLIDGGYLSDKAQIQAFVLGSKVKAREMKLGDNGNIQIIPKQYHVILNKAENRLFNLEKTIRESKNIGWGTGDKVMDDVLKQKELDDF